MSTITHDVYFQFEQDFIEENVRCIPMIVRFKLDVCGIKLKLKEWSKMTVGEREALATFPCETNEQIKRFNRAVKLLVAKHTGGEATDLPVIQNPAWAAKHQIPIEIQKKMNEFESSMSLTQWQRLTQLQRFALVKLSAEGHENKNFPIAIKEFNLI